MSLLHLCPLTPLLTLTPVRYSAAPGAWVTGFVLLSMQLKVVQDQIAHFENLKYHSNKYHKEMSDSSFIFFIAQQTSSVPLNLWLSWTLVPSRHSSFNNQMFYSQN